THSLPNSLAMTWGQRVSSSYRSDGNGEASQRGMHPQVFESPKHRILFVPVIFIFSFISFLPACFVLPKCCLYRNPSEAGCQVFAGPPAVSARISLPDLKEENIDNRRNTYGRTEQVHLLENFVLFAPPSRE